MKGYAKIKENNPFFHRSKSKKQSPFLDQDLDDHININSTNFGTKPPLENDQKSNINQFDNKNIKNDLHNVENKYVLRRNSSVSSSKTSFFNPKNGKSTSDDHQQSVSDIGWRSSAGSEIPREISEKSCNLERQSSTRVVKEAVKRVISMRRSTSVNCDRYSRIYDQPNNFEDGNNYENIHDCGNSNYDNDCHDDDFERSGSMVKNMKNNNDGKNSKNNGKMHVGSKVVKACKRIFSR